MIDKKVTAEKIAKLLEGCIRNLSEAISVAEAECPFDEYESFKKAAGIFLGELDFKLIYSIYQRHPDLEK